MPGDPKPRSSQQPTGKYDPRMATTRNEPGYCPYTPPTACSGQLKPGLQNSLRGYIPGSRVEIKSPGGDSFSQQFSSKKFSPGEKNPAWPSGCVGPMVRPKAP